MTGKKDFQLAPDPPKDWAAQLKETPQCQVWVQGLAVGRLSLPPYLLTKPPQVPQNG